MSTRFPPWWTLCSTSSASSARLRRNKENIASLLWASPPTPERTSQAWYTTFSRPSVSYPRESGGNVSSLDLAAPSKSKVTFISRCFICLSFQLIDYSLGDLVGFYSLHGRFSPCVLLQTLSYNSTSPASETAKPSAPTPSTPRKRRLGEPPTLTARHIVTSTETPSSEVDEPEPPPPKPKSSRASKGLGKGSAS